MNKFLIQRRALLSLGRVTSFLGLELPPLPSVCAIIIQKGKILVVDLAYKKGYSLPGGGLKQNETLEEGLAREIKEETNLDISKSRYLSSHKYSESGITHVSMCFLVTVKDYKKLKSSEEGKALWITPSELYDNCAYKDVEMHIKDYFKF